MPDELAGLTDAELEQRVEEIRGQMRPLDEQLRALRMQRDVLLTEKRRRERGAHRDARAELKSAMKEGRFPNVAQLVEGSQEGSLDDFVYNLKTGGEVRLGFPGARTQALAFTDGAQAARGWMGARQPGPAGRARPFPRDTAGAARPSG